jgi:hypothetical protein
MTFSAEYSAMRCGKEKESTQQSAFNTQPRRFTAKDAETAKSGKKLAGNFVSSMNRVTHTATAAFDLRVLGGKRGLAEC